MKKNGRWNTKPCLTLIFSQAAPFWRKSESLILLLIFKITSLAWFFFSQNVHFTQDKQKSFQMVTYRTVRMIYNGYGFFTLYFVVTSKVIVKLCGTTRAKSTLQCNAQIPHEITCMCVWMKIVIFKMTHCAVLIFSMNTEGKSKAWPCFWIFGVLSRKVTTGLITTERGTLLFHPFMLTLSINAKCWIVHPLTENMRWFRPSLGSH